jgi:hypothetical protein
MMENLYLTSCAAHAFVATEPPLDIRALWQTAWGSPPRRTSRLTDLSLLGALPCAEGRLTSATRTGIYLGSGHGNVADISVILRQLLVEDLAPMPLTFINVSSNMAGYYLSQGLGLRGRNIAVTAGEGSFDAAIVPALLDLECGAVTQALIGAVETGAYPLDAYRAQRGVNGVLAESSAWMMLSREAGGAPLAQVRCARHFSQLADALAELERLPEATRYLVAGGLPEPIKARLQQRGIAPLAGEVAGHNPSIAAYQLLHAVAQGGWESLLYLRGSAQTGLFLMWLSRC